MNKKIQFFFAAAFVFASNVSAQIFYVDATNGNDGWTGSLPDAQATDGPWRTLSKVNNSSFLPGDSILFKCDGVWREQLDIPSSGTVANPIVYGAYGTQCDNTNKPKFSGADIVSNWSLQSGKIYSALSTLTKHSPNLVRNGTFDNDYNSWGAYLSTRAISSDCGGYSNCLSIVATGAGGLAASSPFKLVYGDNYRISFRMRATENIGTTVTVRRATSPYDAVGFNKSIAVSTNWQSYTYDFPASISLENAKIDFYATAKEIFIDDVRIFSITAQPNSVKQIYVDNSFINLAQYPNPRASQTDTYHLITPTIDGAADNPGCPGSGAGVNSFRAKAYPIGDTQNQDPVNQDMVGAGIHIRTNEWLMDDRVVSAYDPVQRIFSLDTASSYVLCKDWGFYLDNKLWMLDAPGEWFFDSASMQTYAWMPDSAVPGNRVEASHREFGIDARDKAYVVIDGLRVEKALVGVDLSGTTGVEIRNSQVRDTGKFGIVASNASFPIIVNSSVENSVRDGIVAINAINATIRGNFVLNTGNVGSPKKSVAAIHAGAAKSALIDNNHLLNSGYIGIAGGINDVISSNYVENSCLVLDDCGAIYTNSSTNGFVALNTNIVGNVVRNTTGNANGKPSNRASSAQGIYLDDSSHAVKVQGNTIINTDLGILIHNGYDNVLTQNTVYGARSASVNISESVLVPRFTVRNNLVETNLFFPTKASATYRLYGAYDNNDFGTYNLNRYSSLYSTQLVNEDFKPGGVLTNAQFTLAQWQQLRNHDLSSTSFDLFGTASQRTLSNIGGGLLANSTFDNSVTGWGTYLGALGSPKWTPACIDGGCLQYQQGTADGHVNTRLSVEANKTYLVRFDVRGSEGQTIAVSLRRADTPYEVVGLSKTFQIGSAWQSYALYAYPETTLAASAANLHFHVLANQSIDLDNVVVQEVAAEINNVDDDSAILINTNLVSEAKDCPDAATNPAKCSQYVRFADESSVQWPVTVPAMGSEIVVWSQNPMRDSDRDGVADSNDICFDAPPVNVPVDERGCSFAQRHSANLGILLTDTPDPAVVGRTVNYTVTVTNTGPLAATNVMTSGSLPGCSLGTIPNGGSATCAHTIPADTAGVLSQTVSVSGTETDASPGNNSASTSTNVQAMLTLSKTGSGTVTSDLPGINCGADCSEAYNANTAVTLTAAAGTGSVFGSWSGCDSSSGTSCTISMNTSKTVTANFTGGGDNQLQNGVPVTGLSGSAKSKRYFTFMVPAGASNTKFEIRGGTGDADLYVRFGATPTTSAYDCRPYRNGNIETCLMLGKAGTWYVMIHGYRSFSGVTLVGSYQ